MSGDDLLLVLRSAVDVRGVRRLLAALGVGARASSRVVSVGESDGRVRARLLTRERGVEGWLVEARESGGSAQAARICRELRAADPCGHHLVIAGLRGFSRVLIGTLGAGDAFRHVVFEPARVRASDVELLSEMIASDGESGLPLAARYTRALDRERLGRRFFEAFRLQRGVLAAAWRGVPGGAGAERAQLALLLLCRIMFLYFLQRRGHLAGRSDYLPSLVAAHRLAFGTASKQRSFYRSTLAPLFFGALNRRPHVRTPAARALGALPYLNGGLFQRHALERAHPRLDLADEALLPVFHELFERYHFTTSEVEPGDAGAPPTDIDPEMLGRVFEGMMAADERGATGTFFTPPGTVDGIVRDALTLRLAKLTTLPEELVRSALDGDAACVDAEAAVRLRRAAAELRALDPACGSGAFLLGALSRLARLNGGDRRAVVSRVLHGVDVQADAALLCALRLWLTLAADADAHGGEVPPLPNLDRRIRQGDSLVDPLDVGLAGGDVVASAAASDAGVRRAVRALAPHAASYADATPEARTRLLARIDRGERRVAAAWLAALRVRCGHRISELRASAAARDLFGEATEEGAAAARQLVAEQARALEIERWQTKLCDDGALPFFSYPVHFAEARHGFDVVVANPPWVRAHRWPAAGAGSAAALRQRFEVCRGEGGRGAGQVDLALLFLERCLRLCADGGALGIVLPAKLLRSGYAGIARRMLLRDARVVRVEDHSLDQRAIFDADAFAATIVAERRVRRYGAAAGGVVHEGASDAAVCVRMTRRNVTPIDFRVRAGELPLRREDATSPWLLAPPDARRALRRMQTAGMAIGATRGLALRRGVVTGANDRLVVMHATPRIGALATVRREDAAGEVLLDAHALRPLLRGCDVAAWRAQPSAHVLWPYDDALRYAPTRRLRALLDAEGDAVARGGRLQRLSRETLGVKVVWRDIAATLEAAALPSTVRSPVCGNAAVIPLNTVYYAPLDTWEEALVLAGLLNSLPMRVFARAIAERAKDARFRFFASTVGALPLPAAWSTADERGVLVAASEAAHARGAALDDERAAIDDAVARMFRLDHAEVAALRNFDAWLDGKEGGVP